MVADPKLALDITQVGAMTSIFPIAYGMSKFVSGVLGARMSPSVLLAGGLMATAVINVAFGFGSSLAWFCFFWALNGTLQVRGGVHIRAGVPKNTRILQNTLGMAGDSPVLLCNGLPACRFMQSNLESGEVHDSCRAVCAHSPVKCSSMGYAFVKSRC